MQTARTSRGDALRTLAPARVVLAFDADAASNPHVAGAAEATAEALAAEGWEVPRDSFFQNNFLLLPKLVDVARNFLADAAEPAVGRRPVIYEQRVRPMTLKPAHELRTGRRFARA